MPYGHLPTNHFINLFIIYGILSAPTSWYFNAMFSFYFRSGCSGSNHTSRNCSMIINVGLIVWREVVLVLNSLHIYYTRSSLFGEVTTPVSTFDPWGQQCPVTGSKLKRVANKNTIMSGEVVLILSRSGFNNTALLSFLVLFFDLLLLSILCLLANDRFRALIYS